jgi:GT2 family glycosyltransferase
MNNIAVLITCFNRREKTLRCLKCLFEIDPTVSVYLVDDGSTDYTAHAVSDSFPAVKIIIGEGNLFWSRGMHRAWQQAHLNPHDYFLWLNDDVVLRPDCLTELLECAAATKNRAIVSGIIDSHDHETIIYGAAGRDKKLLQPNGQMQEIINMNGNVVLVPRAVFDVLGNLDPVFHHDLGDVDYGLRARKHGIQVVTTRKVVGSCDANDVCRVRVAGSHLRQRFKRLYSPLGNHPNLNFYFRRRHYGLLNAMAYYLHIHLINILPDKLVKIIFGNKYFNK